MWQHQLRCLRGWRKRAEQEPAYNPGREHKQPRYEPDRNSADNRSPRFHQRARNHQLTIVVITEVEKMIPSARGRSQLASGRASHEAPRSPPA